MRSSRLLIALFAVLSCGVMLNAQTAANQAATQNGASHHFAWPNGKRAAVSLSFDDARLSQIDTGLALFRKMDVKVTFFVVPSNVEKRLDGWKRAVADGHEIANHSLTHPCTANYGLSQDDVLENYDLRKMAAQLDGANQQITRLLGVKPVDFAYPCGLKFVSRGLDVRSYVPLVADRFLVGRGYLDESPNNPAVVDLSQAMGTAFDDTDFAHMKKVVDAAIEKGSWVIFVGHEIGHQAFQTTDTNALEELCAYLKDPSNGVWLGTVQEIGTYVRAHQKTGQ